MANLLLTSDCRGAFPSDCVENESGPPSQSWSWENLIYLADFLWASNQQQVSFGGGEPTLHPECLDFILYLLHRGFDVTVFTAGDVSSPRLEEFRSHLTEVPTARLTWVCNFQDPVATPISPEAAQRLQHFLSVMGPWTQAAFSINRLDFTLDFLFDHLSRFGLQRQMRLGLARPGAGGQVPFIPANKVRRVVERLYSQRHLFEAHHVRPRLDCGFPPCAFSDAQLGWLHRCGGHGPSGCRPALVISPDMHVSHCLPLANYHRKSLFWFDSLEHIDRYWARRRDEINGQSAGGFEACASCRSRENDGCGGADLCRIVGRGLDAAPMGPAGGEDGISPDRLPG